MKNKISVIVPTYNLNNYIVDCLNSISNQSFQNWECIIVNDGSSDNSEVTIKNYIKNDSRFIYIYQDNQGVSSARNKGVLHSNGKYILPLDGDDILLPGFLEQCYDLFEKNDHLRLIYTKGVFFDGVVSEWKLPNYSYSTLLNYNILPNTSMFYKDDYLRVGGYRINMKFGFEDWDFWIALLSIYPDNSVFRIDEVLFKYRILENSRSSHLENIDNLSKMTNRILQNNFEIYSGKFGDLHEKVVSFENLKKRQDKWPVKLILKFLDLAFVIRLKKK